ncbi:MAG: serpin family protein, partial [Deltaproteobacteria bacterium]|nr:serpin family protein [Deltaproteobacteria bacterium]
MSQQIRRWLSFALLLAVACGGTTDTGEPGQELRSDKARITSPDVPASDLESLVGGNTGFAIDAYQQLAAATDGNVFFSPH